MEIIIQDHRPNKSFDEKPIAGAYKKSFIAHDVRKFKTDFVKRYYLKETPDWYTIGYNHVDSSLELSRFINCIEWCVAIETPEELFQFINRGQNGDEDYTIYLTSYRYDYTMPAINIV